MPSTRTQRRRGSARAIAAVRRLIPPSACLPAAPLSRALLLVSALGAAVLTPGPAMSAEPVTPPAGGASRVVELANLERQRAGLPPLGINPQLAVAAQGYAIVLAEGSCFSHTCGPIPSFVQRSEQAGYTAWVWLGENIAAGQGTPEVVLAAWMASPAHRANILSPNFSEVGVGVSAGAPPWGMYWVQEFGAQPPAVVATAPPADGDAPTDDWDACAGDDPISPCS